MTFHLWGALLVGSTLAACGGDDDDGPPAGDADADADADTDADTDADADSDSDADADADGDVPGDGIAARHPGDVGIADDPDVIFVDDFESYADQNGLWDRWAGGFWGQTSITSEDGEVHAGAQAVEFMVPQQAEEAGAAVGQVLAEELDVLYLRWYAKIEPTFDVRGSSHNGGGISAHYVVDGQATPGVPADGTNKFLVEYECWRGDDGAEPNPGYLNAYVYHPEQRDIWGDHFFPDGIVSPYTLTPFDFGPEFVARPNVAPELGRWYAFELMVQANTPGQRDGRITMWLDGEIVADFPNLRLRDVDTLTIDRFDVGLHIKSNTSAETRKWVDDVVAARSYIGPTVP